jgi:O-antigen ligase
MSDTAKALSVSYSLALAFVMALGVFVGISAHARPAAAAVGGGALAVGLYLYSRHPFGMLLLFIFLIPLDRLLWLPGTSSAFSIVKLQFLPLMLVVCWRILIRREPVRFPRQAIYVLLFASALTVSALLMKSRIHGMRGFMILLRLIAFYFIVVQMVRERKQLRLIVLCLIVSNCLVSLAGLAQYHAGISVLPGGLHGASAAQKGRFTALALNDPNIFASEANLALFLALVLFIYIKNVVPRVLLLLAICLLSYSVALSFSRGGFLSMLVGFSLVAVMFRSKINISTIVPGAVCIVTAIAVLAPPGYWERLLTLAGGSMDYSLNSRAAQHIIALDLFQRSPIIGIGPINFPYYFREKTFRYLVNGLEKGWMLHNMYLSVLLDAGLVGFIPFMALLGSSLSGLYAKSRAWSARKAYSRLDQAIPGALFAAMVVYLFANTFLSAEYEKYLWLLVALASCVSIADDPKRQLKYSHMDEERHYQHFCSECEND